MAPRHDLDDLLYRAVRQHLEEAHESSGRQRVHGDEGGDSTKGGEGLSRVATNQSNQAPNQSNGMGLIKVPLINRLRWTVYSSLLLKEFNPNLI